MTRGSIVRLMVALGLGLLTPAAWRALALAQDRTCDGMMSGSMMGGGMMSGESSGDMQMVMQLFEHHSQIRRTVEAIPGGIRTVTESDDPQVAALLQAHVASMYQRVDQGRVFSMISRTLPTMFRNASRYRRHMTATPKGVAIEETSKDPKMVAVLREHAREVTGFVNEGMSAMMGGMTQDMMESR